MSDTATVKKNAINWFEIPCGDLERATNFYEKVLGTKMHRAVSGQPMSIFATDQTGTGGTLIKRSVQKPGSGAVVYLNCDGELDSVIERVSAAGGLVLMPKTEVPGGFGYWACVRDSEGNHVGLHSHQ